ncbi:hypothetical protein [Nocardia transvalensis]|uniref:hypothetical protein n=1 Tax=Nocardia transvalensis TaxID=37333 RepID=UPI0018963961|nr:hypothetical protein [Nocardia transvalensis]MBF6332779.1 hypothetical protein [Nocardia transvalensis]
MTLAQPQLTLTLHGRLDQEQLDQLCANLGLTVSTAASAPTGTELGHRTYRHPKYQTITEAAFTLVRTADHAWTLTLAAIPGHDADKWRCLAEMRCRAAGLTIAERTHLAPQSPDSEE